MYLNFTGYTANKCTTRQNKALCWWEIYMKLRFLLRKSLTQTNLLLQVSGYFVAKFIIIR